MNCLAIDDEPLALNVIREFCQKIGYVNLLATCTNPFEAIKWINVHDIDLIFVDIQMPNITGIEFIRTLEKPPLIIFTTAFPNYALEGFELNAIDYLVKPVSFERFLKAINKAYEMVMLRKNKVGAVKNPDEQISEPSRYLMVKVEYKTVRIDLDQILYIEGLKDYIKIYTGVKPILTKCTMKAMEEKLPGTRFIRVHKSFIVALSKIQSVENNRILIGEERIPVGNQYKGEFDKTIDSSRV